MKALCVVALLLPLGSAADCAATSGIDDKTSLMQMKTAVRHGDERSDELSEKVQADSSMCTEEKNEIAKLKKQYGAKSKKTHSYLYLPKKIDGDTVLADGGNGTWMATLAKVMPGKVGIHFRGSKQIHDKIEDRLFWGELLQGGVDEADGWVRFPKDAYHARAPNMKAIRLLKQFSKTNAHRFRNEQAEAAHQHQDACLKDTPWGWDSDTWSQLEHISQESASQCSEAVAAATTHGLKCGDHLGEKVGIDDDLCSVCAGTCAAAKQHCPCGDTDEEAELFAEAGDSAGLQIPMEKAKKSLSVALLDRTLSADAGHANVDGAVQRKDKNFESLGTAIDKAGKNWKSECLKPPGAKSDDCELKAGELYNEICNGGKDKKSDKESATADSFQGRMNNLAETPNDQTFAGKCVRGGGEPATVIAEVPIGARWEGGTDIDDKPLEEQCEDACSKKRGCTWYAFSVRDNQARAKNKNNKHVESFSKWEWCKNCCVLYGGGGGSHVNPMQGDLLGSIVIGGVRHKVGSDDNRADIVQWRCKALLPFYERAEVEAKENPSDADVAATMGAMIPFSGEGADQACGMSLNYADKAKKYGQSNAGMEVELKDCKRACQDDSKCNYAGFQKGRKEKGTCNLFAVCADRGNQYTHQLEHKKTTKTTSYWSYKDTSKWENFAKVFTCPKDYPQCLNHGKFCMVKDCKIATDGKACENGAPFSYPPMGETPSPDSNEPGYTLILGIANTVDDNGAALLKCKLSYGGSASKVQTNPGISLLQIGSEGAAEDNEEEEEGKVHTGKILEDDISLSVEGDYQRDLNGGSTLPTMKKLMKSSLLQVVKKSKEQEVGERWASLLQMQRQGKACKKAEAAEKNEVTNGVAGPDGTVDKGTMDEVKSAFSIDDQVACEVEKAKETLKKLTKKGADGKSEEDRTKKAFKESKKTYKSSKTKLEQCNLVQTQLLDNDLILEGNNEQAEVNRLRHRQKLQSARFLILEETEILWEIAQEQYESFEKKLSDARSAKRWLPIMKGPVVSFMKDSMPGPNCILYNDCAMGALKRSGAWDNDEIGKGQAAGSSMRVLENTENRSSMVSGEDNSMLYMAKTLIDNFGNYKENAGNMARTIVKDAISFQIDYTIRAEAQTRTEELLALMWSHAEIGVQAFQAAAAGLIGAIPFVGGFLASLVSWLIQWAYMIIQRTVNGLVKNLVTNIVDLFKEKIATLIANTLLGPEKIENAADTQTGTAAVGRGSPNPLKAEEEKLAAEEKKDSTQETSLLSIEEVETLPMDTPEDLAKALKAQMQPIATKGFEAVEKIKLTAPDKKEAQSSAEKEMETTAESEAEEQEKTKKDIEEANADVSKEIQQDYQTVVLGEAA